MKSMTSCPRSNFLYTSRMVVFLGSTPSKVRGSFSSKLATYTKNFLNRRFSNKPIKPTDTDVLSELTQMVSGTVELFSRCSVRQRLAPAAKQGSLFQQESSTQLLPTAGKLGEQLPPDLLKRLTWASKKRPVFGICHQSKRCQALSQTQGASKHCWHQNPNARLHKAPLMCFNPLQIGEARQGLLKHSTRCSSMLCQFESLQNLLTRQQWGQPEGTTDCFTAATEITWCEEGSHVQPGCIEGAVSAGVTGAHNGSTYIMQLKLTGCPLLAPNAHHRVIMQFYSEEGSVSS